MKHRVFIYIIALAATLRVEAQTSIEEVLRSVEANNKELQATRQQVEAQTLEAKLDNNLPDPTVTYSHLYGNQEGMGFTGEFIASQSFDFPSLYAQRRKWSKLQGENFNKQGEEVRQQILLQAKEVCLDLILLNQQQRLLDLRRENAEQLSKLYAERLENGDANILETNKINLELLNVRNEARMNEATRTAKLQELAALNGGIAISFTDTAYVPVDQPASLADLQQEVLTADRRLQSLRSAQQAALRQISVSKFSNRNNVKQAKAQSLYTDLQLESATTVVENELMQLYNRSVALKASIDEYRTELDRQNSLALLNKAIQAGQISMIEYFVDVTTLYQSLQNYMQLQNEYQKVMAQIYKYQL